ncbi:MAG: pyrroline-5-carboxylate reductase dimerization domain-containing protein, partial [bacterium]|nr:pyrroline-5-carboxylate reductase dimerization domain-containing protein [bacterium]
HEVKLGESSVVVSVMAGISLERLAEELGTTRVVRSIPSVAARVGASMTVWIGHSSLTPQERTNVQQLFEAMGEEIEVEEEATLDAAGVTGCIAGWLYHVLSLFEEQAEKLGFSPEQAQEIVRQMFIGAAKITEGDERSFTELRGSAASKGGVTESGIAVLSNRDLSGIMQEVFETALKRVRELGL